MHGGLRSSMLNGKKYFFFILNFFIGTIFLTILFYHALSLSVQKSLLFAGILSFVFDLAYIFEKIRKKNTRKPQERVVYSWKNFFMELLFFLFVFTTARFSGVRLEKSIAMALYIFILFTIYYSQLPHKYVIPSRILRIRLIIIFVGITSGLHMFVIDSIILSGLIGAIFTVITEKNYKIAEKLLSEGILEEKFMEKRAWIIFYSISYGYGAAIGLMFVSKIHSASFFGEWLLVMFRLLYIFTTIFIPLGTLIGWARIKLHEGRKREK